MRDAAGSLAEPLLGGAEAPCAEDGFRVAHFADMYPVHMIVLGLQALAYTIFGPLYDLANGQPWVDDVVYTAVVWVAFGLRAYLHAVPDRRRAWRLGIMLAEASGLWRLLVCVAFAWIIYPWAAHQGIDSEADIFCMQLRGSAGVADAAGIGLTFLLEGVAIGMVPMCERGKPRTLDPG